MPGNMTRTSVERLAAAALALLVLAGCASVPAGLLSVDRMEYSQVLSASWKRQTLLNVVRLRNADAPVFLEVASIVNSYSVQSRGSAGANLFAHSDPDELSMGIDHTWSNSPTVTYQPLTGERFIASMLGPVPLPAVVQLLQSGWPVDLVMPAVVGAVNGVRSEGPGMVEDGRFRELVEVLSRLQRAGGLMFFVEGVKSMMRIAGGGDPRLAADARRARELLGLAQDASDFEVVYGLIPHNRKQVAIVNRSMLEILLRLGGGIELPETERGRVIPLLKPVAEPQTLGLARIRSGPKAPEDAYASVRYKGNWYWIDDADVPSKRIFTFVMILFSLAETMPNPGSPVLTVPAR